MNDVFIFKDEFTPELLKEKLIKNASTNVKSVYANVVNKRTGVKVKLLAASTTKLLEYLRRDPEYDEIKKGTLKDRIRNPNNIDFGYIKDDGDLKINIE